MAITTLPFNLKLPARPAANLDKATYDELVVVYDAIIGLAEQLASNELLDWVDYSAQSVITGWSNFTRKVVKYRYLNYNTVLVLYDLAGTSNNTQAAFSLPVIAAVTVNSCVAKVTNNSAALTTPGLATMNINSSNVSLYKDSSAAVWTASGSKSVSGQFIYVI